MDIDFVIMWVDGSDPEWLAEKRKYDTSVDQDDKEERYRDWDILKYWFRGVQNFAPWVRTIHFVTHGHLPMWLDPTNPKLHIVNHKDFIPEDKLPLFNSSSIECYLNRIEGLSEQFVLFNDDMFLINHMKPEHFFRNGKTVDMLAFQPVVANPSNPVMSSIYMNNSLVLCRHFNKRECVKKRPGDFFHLGYPFLYFFYNLLELGFPLFTGFYTPHGPSPMLKSVMDEIWEVEYEALDASTSNRFRSKNDLTQYLFREWTKLSGKFVPKNVHRYLKYFEVSDENQKLYDCIRKKKSLFLCINDTGLVSNLDKTILELQQAFEHILPEKSDFER